MTAACFSVPSHGSTKLREATLADLLVWVYQRQKADVMSGRGLWGPEAEIEAAEEGLAVRRWSGCGCAQLEAIARLGVRVDSGGWQRATLHSDAETVHDQVIEISRKDWLGASLLRRYGQAGGAPEWDIRQEYEPLRDGSDRIVQDRFVERFGIRDASGRVRDTPAKFCPIEKYPSDDWVDMARAEYRLWHGALTALGRRLAPLPLVRWRLTGLGAEALPWLRKNEIGQKNCE